MLDNLRKEIKKQIATYILAGLGLVTGLAWNDAIKGLIEKYFPLASGGGVVAKFLYAVVITTVVVVISLYVFKSDEEKK